MDQHKNIPVIRFKGFQEEWIEKLLSSVINYRNGKAHENSIDEKGEYIVVNSKFVSTNGIVKKFSNKQFAPLYKNELAFVLSDVPNGRAMARTFLVERDNKYTLNQRIAALTPKDEYNCNFLHRLINRHSYFLKFDDGVKQTNLRRSDVENFTARYPYEPEQTQIGNFFKTIDEQINLQEQKHQKLIHLKKAMLEKMFPKEGANVPEIRFKGFTEKWEEKKLGDVVEFYSGLTYSPKDVKDSKHTLVLRSSNVKNNSIVLNDNVYVDNSVINSSNVLKGDIIVVVRNGSRNLIGKHAQIKEIMPNTVIGAFMTGVRYNIPNFLNAILDSNRFIIEIEKNLGATINQITTGAFKAMLFKFPSIEEQQKIGAYFEQLDALIQQSQVKIEKYKNIKQALLQKMFV